MLSIQITDALIFLHQLHHLHCGITSHAVHLVNYRVAKLGQFEFLTDTRHSQTGAHSQTPPECLYNWMSPEVLRGDAVSVVSDVYSMCCVVYELSTGVLV